ncbi:MAG TPA: hypothetical protein VFY03_00225 [Woeseiaceae bacterium]|nr:hypothetical protein [Woeseiaceae bacterium]
MTNRNHLLLPVLLAAGSTLGAGSAAALELGDLNVESRLGQPLRASIAYALAPNEELAAYCVSVVPPRTLDGTPVVGETRIRVQDGAVHLEGRDSLREPVTSLRLAIDCPYSARFSRDYTILLDPAVPVPHAIPAPTLPAAAEPVAPAAVRQARAPAATAPAADTALPVTAGQRYQVRRGDTLLAIAGRHTAPGVPLWRAADALFAANPGAFIDGDPNRLKAGAWLVVHGVAADTAAPATAVAPGLVLGDATPTAGDASAAPPAAGSAQALSVPAAESVAATGAATTAVTGAAAATPGNGFGALEPGDVLVAATAAPAVGAAPASTLGAPLEIVAAPGRDAARDERAPLPRDTSGGTLGLLVTGGFGLLAALLLLRLRAWRGSRRRTPGEGAPETGTDREEAGRIPTLDIAVADDYDLDDDSPTAENLVLDADLDSGSGFDDSDPGDMFVAEDFGFDTHTDLDLELPESAASPDAEPGTNVIPPLRIEESSILESEILPEDDYDMSIITDATKMPDPDAVTERDLKAVVVSGPDDTRVNDVYTVSQDVDYQVLEQDYEEELSATAALNLEIAKAAAELGERLDAEILAEGTVNRRTRAPLASGSPFSILAAAVNDDDAGDSDVTARLEAGRSAEQDPADGDAGRDADADTDIMLAGERD